ncbi:MAG: carboxypeptidase regulatory-like domain-containing protein [Candidatus Sulfotelmatobacter sp.]
MAALFIPLALQWQPIQAQKVGIPSEPAASLHGVVRDSDRRPVVGATVSLQAKGAQALTVHTDRAGAYYFSALRPGVYHLYVEMVGYRNATVSDFSLEQRESRAMDLTLDLARPSEPQKSPLAEPAYFDEPHFTVAGVTDTTNLGGHGSDVIVRNREALARETVSLRKPPADNQPDSIAQQHHRLADSDEKLGKPLEAVREYQRAAELNPSESNIFDWGTELLLHRAAEPAIEVFNKGNRLFPQSIRMLTGLAAALYAQGFYEQAMQRLCEASDVNPGDPEPYLSMGKIQAVEATRSAAIAERLERFVKLQPDNALANYYYALSLWKLGHSTQDVLQMARVKPLLERAIHLDPKLGLAYFQLGILYSDEKDLANAILAYQQAIAASPQLEQAHYRLAQAYRQAGKTSEAQAELRLYEQISKEEADEIERQRHEVQQFVYELQGQPAAVQQK